MTKLLLWQNLCNPHTMASEQSSFKKKNIITQAEKRSQDPENNYWLHTCPMETAPTPRCTSIPSILHEYLFPCHNFKRGQPFFWKLSHAISGVCPEHGGPSETICQMHRPLKGGRGWGFSKSNDQRHISWTKTVENSNRPKIKGLWDLHEFPFYKSFHYVSVQLCIQLGKDSDLYPARRHN